MFARIATVALLATVGLNTASAEVVVLKEKAAVTGKILAEKRDSVIVDLGYTVLTIPRAQITRILKEEEEKPAKPAKSKAAPIAAPATAQKVDDADLFRLSKGNVQEKTVRELVTQLGESVVQVRTPGGLGSGFFLNEEGYLITNFHVIEGETQISIEVYHQKDGQLERKVYKQVRIVAMNKFQDLTLLKVEDKDASKFSTLSRARSWNLFIATMRICL